MKTNQESISSGRQNQLHDWTNATRNNHYRNWANKNAVAKSSNMRH